MPICTIPSSIEFEPARREGELDSLPNYVREAREGRLSLGGLAGGSIITDEEYREIIAHTYGMITMVDHSIGRIVKALENIR